MFGSRRSYSVVSFIFLAATLAMPVRALAAGDTVLTEADAGRKVVLHVGDTATIRLNGAREPGSRWTLEPIGSDSDSVTTIGDVPGEPGPFTLHVAAVRVGIATLRLQARVSGANDASATMAFLVDVTNVSEALDPAAFTPAIAVTKRETIVYPGGASYRGGLANGAPQGFGTLDFAPNSGGALRAEGAWNGQTLTNGVVTFASGVRYIGNLAASGAFEGAGRFYYPNGDVLSTVFADGKFSGKTTLIPARSDARSFARKYVVTIDPPSRSFDGPAIVTIAPGYALAGSVHDGRFDGPGTYRWDDVAHTGRVATLRGNFVDGKFEGRFVYTDFDGSAIHGFMEHGKPQADAVLTTPGGTPCVGRLASSGEFYAFAGALDADGRPNGRGTFGCDTADKVTGRLTHGKFVGVFRGRLSDGATYLLDVGPRPTDALAGPATVTFRDGTSVRGRFARDGSFSHATAPRN